MLVNYSFNVMQIAQKNGVGNIGEVGLVFIKWNVRSSLATMWVVRVGALSSDILTIL